jgi:hypothetical protein
MNKKTVMIVLVTAVIVLLVAPRLRQLPVVNKLPTI